MKVLSSDLNLGIGILFSLLLRWIVSHGPYSGKGVSPKFGDYEAQRHWQEITVNLKITDWYNQTKDNDLGYWGLDYPPLTAYHSWACGKVAHFFNPKWVELHKSRGFEGESHKFFMRATVLMVDLLIYFPAVLLMSRLSVKSFEHCSDAPKSLHSFAIMFLLYPGIILIDYGHFQYNNFSLGLFLMSVSMFQRRSDIMGSVLFCLALSYKQMELYHALPIFCYLLGKIFELPLTKGFNKFALLAATVVATMLIIWFPFLSLKSLSNVISRIFPVGRGLYEDKVANIWCTISPVIKLKDLLSIAKLSSMCVITTFLASLPSITHLLFHPRVKVFKYSLVNVSLAFFLFSYHVHEKSILIPAVTSILLYHRDVSLPLTIMQQYSVVSMMPLLYKDGLAMQTIVLSLMFQAICGFEFASVQKQVDYFLRTLLDSHDLESRQMIVVKSAVTKVCRLWWALSYVLMASHFFSAPANLPDLFALLTSVVCCGVFVLCFVIFNVLQLKL